jgi:hypothetical protein
MNSDAPGNLQAPLVRFLPLRCFNRKGGDMAVETREPSVDGGLVVELTKAAFEALRRECREQMDAAIGDLGKGSSRERERLNACADALYAISAAQGGWSLEDPREEADVKACKFSAEAVAFLREQRDATERHIAELDRSSEAEYEYMGRECLLLHVLDRVFSEGVAA